MLLGSECCDGGDRFYKGGYNIVVKIAIVRCMLCHGGSNLFIYQAREYDRNPVGTRLDSLAWLIHQLSGSGNGGVVVVVVLMGWY